MDRKGQLSRVAFGGAWSEQIDGNESMSAAMAKIERAVQLAEDEDFRGDDELKLALRKLATAHPKGGMLVAAWESGLSVENAGLRRVELKRIAEALRAGLGSRLKECLVGKVESNIRSERNER